MCQLQAIAFVIYSIEEGSPDEASFTVIEERYLSSTPPYP
jgi:hypothetical protein